MFIYVLLQHYVVCLPTARHKLPHGAGTVGWRLSDRVLHHRQEVLQLRHGHPGQLAESETQQQPSHHPTRQQSGPGASKRGRWLSSWWLLDLKLIRLQTSIEVLPYCLLQVGPTLIIWSKSNSSQWKKQYIM